MNLSPRGLIVGWQVTGTDLHGIKVSEAYRYREYAMMAYDTLASGTLWSVHIGGKRTLEYRKRSPRPANIFAMHIR